MTEQTALLRAIRASPDDDTVRLVYADWLDENDAAARAEYIRVQVAFARRRAEIRTRPRADPLLAGLEERQCELFWRHWATWTAELKTRFGPDLLGVTFRRGFPDDLVLARGGVARLPSLFADLDEIPPRGLTVAAPFGDHELRHLDSLTELQRLALRGTAVSDLGLRHLYRLVRLRRLDLRDTAVTRGGVRTLAECPYLSDGLMIHIDAAGIPLGRLRRRLGINSSGSPERGLFVFRAGVGRWFDRLLAR